MFRLFTNSFGNANSNSNTAERPLDRTQMPPAMSLLGRGGIMVKRAFSKTYKPEFGYQSLKPLDLKAGTLDSGFLATNAMQENILRNARLVSPFGNQV